MDDDAQPCSRSGRRPLEHLEIAVGIAERRNWPPTDHLVDADRLASTIVNMVDFCEPQQYGDALWLVVFHLDAAADDLLWWNSVDALDPGDA